MARDLKLQTNVDPVSTDYPSGRIRNDSGVGDGTPVSEALYGDIQQFFAKLLRESGITPNNLPDNKTNGFQFNDALDIAVTISGFSNTGIIFGSGIANDVEGIRVRRVGDLIQLQGVLRNQNTGASSRDLFTLPVGRRPNIIRVFPIGYRYSGDSDFQVVTCRIQTDGLVTVLNLPTNDAGDDFVYFDNISFWKR